MNIQVLRKFFDENNIFSFRNYLILADELRNKRKELIIFCDHPAVITSGRQSHIVDLRISREQIENLGIEFFISPRGGSFTAHEPGQIIIYPHLDLTKRNIMIGDFVKFLIQITRESIFQTWNLDTEYISDKPGLFIRGKKLVSIGLQIKEQFSSLGLAVNFTNSLDTFQHIHPCGMRDVEMTSILKEGGGSMLRDKFIENWLT